MIFRRKKQSIERTVAGLASELGARTHPIDHPPLNGERVTVSATCGLGHRLLRNAKIFHVARAAGYAVGINWFPWDELFESTPELFADKDTGAAPVLRFRNEPTDVTRLRPVDELPPIVPFDELDPPPVLQFDHAGCADEGRWVKEIFSPAACDYAADFHHRLLSQLRSEWARQIDHFASEQLGDSRVVGFHLRTGNGETGDFVNKQRGVDEEAIVRSFARHIDSYDPATTTLLVASDSAKTVTRVRSATDHRVVSFSVSLPDSGHAIGDWVAPATSAEVETHTRQERIRQFFEAYADLVLLGMADDLYAGAWTSFLAAPFMMNRRRSDLGTTLTIFDSNSMAWRTT